MAIDTIELRNVLPRVFRDPDGGASAAAGSEVWLTDMRFERGQIYMVAAESGGGKSSLCSFIYGNRRDYEGTIMFDGVDTRRFSIDKWCEIRRGSIALLPQEMRVFAELTAMENVQLKNRLTDFKSAKEIGQMFERFELSSKINEPAGRLSVGQQQRVAIIRTLCQPFSFLLLDEPVSHLDERNNRSAAALISEAAKAQHAAIIATSVGNQLALDNFRLISL